MSEKVNSSHAKTPMGAWLVIACAALWSPVFHVIRYFLAPDGYTYTGIINQDIADWISVLGSAENHFLAHHDLVKDVPVWYRPDLHSLLLVPPALIVSLFHIPPAVMLSIIDVVGNTFCAYATYRFFRTFLKEDRLAVSAMILCYFASGISGTILLFKWISGRNWALPVVPPGWAGENHAKTNELSEGNMITTLTVMFRPYYVFPRAFGLFALIWLYRYAKEFQEKRFILFSAVCLFAATIVHPQSGLGFAIMTIVAAVFFSLGKEKSANFLWIYLLPIGGFLFAAVIWKLYQRIPDVDEAIKEYTLRMYNTDPVPLIFGTASMIVPILALIIRNTREKSFYVFVLLIVVLATIGLSEHIIPDYSLNLRIPILAFTIALMAWGIWWKRGYLALLIKSQRNSVLLGLWIIVMSGVAVSPHNDALKMVKGNFIDFGIFTHLALKLLDISRLIYAAPFRLGLWVPLSAMFVSVAVECKRSNDRLLQKYILVAILLSLPSVSLFVYGLIRNSEGYLSDTEMVSLLTLKKLPEKNVMCDAKTGMYVSSIAHKRTLLGGVGGVTALNERGNDINLLYSTEDSTVANYLLKKYKIDYVFIDEKNKKVKGCKNLHYINGKEIYKTENIRIFRVSNSQL